VNVLFLSIINVVTLGCTSAERGVHNVDERSAYRRREHQKWTVGHNRRCMATHGGTMIGSTTAKTKTPFRQSRDLYCLYLPVVRNEKSQNG